VAKIKTTKKWRELEKKVANAYRTIGGHVEHDKLLNGDQIDVYVEMPQEDHSVYKIAIEVKDWDGSVGKSVVNQFSKIVDSLKRANLIHKGTIVSANGFSRTQTFIINTSLILKNYGICFWK